MRTLAVRATVSRTTDFAAGTATIADLRGWLEDHAQDVLDADDPTATALADQLWIVVGEVDAGLLDEVGARAAARRLVVRTRRPGIAV